MITPGVCLGNLPGVCRESGAPARERESCCCNERAKRIRPNTVHSPPPPPILLTLTHTSTQTHTTQRQTREGGGLTNRAFISCQSGFIGFKWSLITTVLQSSTTVFSSMGSLRVCVSVDLFPKSSLFP